MATRVTRVTRLLVAFSLDRYGTVTEWVVGGRAERGPDARARRASNVRRALRMFPEADSQEDALTALWDVLDEALQRDRVMVISQAAQCAKAPYKSADGNVDGATLHVVPPKDLDALEEWERALGLPDIRHEVMRLRERLARLEWEAMER